jgi:hypothetical protein
MSHDYRFAPAEISGYFSRILPKRDGALYLFNPQRLD